MAKNGLDKKMEKIGSYYYGPHAVERMEERNLFPSVVEDAIEHGEHYRLKHVEDFGDAKGATDVYIMRDSAKVLEGGKVGQRIIKVDPDKMVEPKSVLILVGPDQKTIKTEDSLHTRQENPESILQELH